jgi:hypothetical protein
MAIFICWSGSESKRFAEDTRSFLEQVLPGIEFFLSSDIEKGALWFGELTSSLQKAKAGVVCLTPQNLLSPWMHFEVGALFSRRKQQRVFVYTLGVRSDELKGPFGHFQSSIATKDETMKMVRSIAKLYRGVPFSTDEFDTRWPGFEERFVEVSHPTIADLINGFGSYLNAKTFAQPLKYCLDQDWLARYSRVKRSLDELNDIRARAEKYLSPEHLSIYQTLISKMDEYLRLLRQIVRSRRFRVVGTQVDFANPEDQSPGIEWISDACEEHQKTIKELTLQLKKK